MSSPRNISGSPPGDRTSLSLGMHLPGTGTLSPKEKREFENLLTSGATGYSPRELRELRERGEELLSQPLQSLSDLQASGSNLVVPAGSRILQATASSGAQSVRSSASASPTEKPIKSSDLQSVGFCQPSTADLLRSGGARSRALRPTKAD
eukprot:scaffold660064_cov39-Prasinocladus_malaysianus.AAC.1